MRTPAGTECKFFYANYFRGRNQQECRLIAANPASDRWSPGLCKGCPVPEILRTNACRHLILEAKVVKTWGGLNRKVAVAPEHRRRIRPDAARRMGQPLRGRPGERGTAPDEEDQ